jgi:hypothetical protein
MPAPENVSILDTLQQIKVSITNLEAMQTTRNTPKTDAPAKTYADVIRTPITAAQLHKHQEQQRIRAQRNSVNYHPEHYRNERPNPTVVSNRK